MQDSRISNATLTMPLHLPHLAQAGRRPVLVLAAGALAALLVARPAGLQSGAAAGKEVQQLTRSQLRASNWKRLMQRSAERRHTSRTAAMAGRPCSLCSPAAHLFQGHLLVFVGH